MFYAVLKAFPFGQQRFVPGVVVSRHDLAASDEQIKNLIELGFLREQATSDLADAPPPLIPPA